MAGAQARDTAATKKGRFLEELRTTGDVAEASRAGGIAEETAYRWRGQDTRFARVWDEVVSDVLGKLAEGWEERAGPLDDGAATVLMEAMSARGAWDRNKTSQPPIHFTIPLRDNPADGSLLDGDSDLDHGEGFE